MFGIRRREFITLMGVAAAARPLAAHAQAPNNIPRLCFLTFDPGTLQSNRFDAFFQGLRDLGYANGRSIAIDYLSAEGNGERFPALAAECLRLKADVIAVSTTPAARAAMAATQHSDHHDRARRPGADRARQQPRPAPWKCHRPIADGSRGCGQASWFVEGGLI